MGYQSGIAITDVNTTAKAVLGSTVTRLHPTNPDYGLQTWVYVYNDEASTAFAVGNVIERDAGTATWDGVIGSAYNYPSQRPGRGTACYPSGFVRVHPPGRRWHYPL